MTTSDDWDPDLIQARIVPNPPPSNEVGLSFDDVEIVDGDYSGLKLDRFSSIGGRFVRCCFDRIQVGMMAVGGAMRRSVFVDCSFDHAGMRMHPGGFARFERCQFTNVNIREWTVNPCDLIDCTFTGTIRKSMFYASILDETRRERYQRAGLEVQNRIVGNDFSGAKLIDVSFRGGVDLWKQRLPQGPGYMYIHDGPAALERARPVIDTWPEPERARGLRALNIFQIEVNGGQHQLFIGKDAWISPIWEKFGAALTGRDK